MAKDQIKNQGRPLLEDGKRNIIIKAKLNTEELKVLEQMEETLKLNRSDLIRNRLFSRSSQNQSSSTEILSRLDQIGAELGRCGNNINQLARHANVLNKNGALKSFELDSYIKVFRAYVEHQKQLDTTLRQLLKAIKG